MSGLAQRVASATIEAVREFEQNSRVRAVSSLDEGQTLVRVSTEDPSSLIEGLRKRLPLASICTVENVSDGKTEAQILVEDEGSLMRRAESLASNGLLASRVAFATKVLFVSGALAFVVLVSLKVALL